MADVGKRSGPSNWHVLNGELKEDSNIFDGFLVGLAGGSAIVEAGKHWTDYRLRLKLRGLDDDVIVLYVRFQDFQNNYSFHWGKQNNSRRIRKMDHGVWSDLVVQSGGYLTGQDYLVELVADGNHLEVWIDGEQVLAADDLSATPLLGGTVGLGVEAMSGVFFDNVHVTAIPPQEVTP